MRFTLTMMVGRLLVGAAAFLAAAFTAEWITRRNGRASIVLAALLLVAFLPVHYGVRDRFPPWYPLVFLVSLVVLTLLGGTVGRSHAPDSSACSA